MSIPLVKLGYLVVRTLSKPIAKIVQQQAANHPSFRAACTRLSQSYHRMEVRLKSRANDRQSPGSTVEDIKPLSEEKAIQLGANFIGEFVIFSFAGLVLLWDGMRTAAIERKRRSDRDERIQNLSDSVESLKLTTLQLEEKLSTFTAASHPKRADALASFVPP